MIRMRWAAVMASAAAVACLLVVTPDAFAAKRQRAITKPKFDPSAERVALFDGMEDGRLNVRVIMKDETEGRVLFENKTDMPLTVELPQAVVGVQVMQQFGAGDMGGGFGTDDGGGDGGGAQPAGGGMMGGMGGMGGMGMGGMGGGFFSIPPEKTVAVPMKSVCLAYGRPEPHPRHEYTLVPVEEFSEDPRLDELLRMISTGRVNGDAAQAAAWHLTDDMSWQELASLKVKRLGGLPDTPRFSIQTIFAAQQLIAMAEERAEKRKEEELPEGNGPRTRTQARVAPTR